ncbi:MAG: BrnT family toxin [Comamonadaceae bacterium]|nr:BrnT family toxin [Comamonadaceae bacterium]
MSFEEAKSAFYDERARLIDDPGHSEDEDRFVLLGLSSALRLWLFATATEARTEQFESSLLARQRPRK